MNERLRLRKAELDKLFKRHHNTCKDLEAQQAHERNKKSHDYAVIASTHDACNFFKNALSIHDRSLNLSCVTGNTKLTWKDQHNSRLLNSLKYEPLQRVEGQRCRNRMVTRAMSEHNALGSSYQGPLKRLESGKIGQHIRDKLNHSMSAHNESLNISRNDSLSRVNLSHVQVSQPSFVSAKAAETQAVPK